MVLILPKFIFYLNWFVIIQKYNFYMHANFKQPQQNLKKLPQLEVDFGPT